MFGLPSEELHHLDFLMGESGGSGQLFPPNGKPVSIKGYLTVEREACDRFVRVDFFGRIPGIVSESIHALIGYSQRDSKYRMWCFASSQDDPIVFTGEFQGGQLIFVSLPTEMVWGYQRLRCCFDPIADGLTDCAVDLWTTEGYMPLFRGVFASRRVRLGATE